MTASIELVRLSCNSCGANLDVGEQTRFVTCVHCGAKLEVRRTGNAAFTDVLQELRQDTDRIADDVRALRRQSEIEALDREWQAQRDALTPRDRRGNATSASGVLTGTLIAVIAGVAWTVFSQTVVHAPMPFSVFGVFFVTFAMWAGFRSHRRTMELDAAERAYRRRREELERR